MANIMTGFIIHKGTKETFEALRVNGAYENAVVYITGGDDAFKSCIFAQNTYFANFTEFIASYISKLSYVKGIHVNGQYYNVPAGGGYIAFKANDPATLDIAVDTNGIEIGLKSDFTNTVNTLKTDNVIGKGEADNSAVLKDLNNKAISEGSVALGKDNIVGLKGFYYKYITLKAGGDTKIANVYLSKTQVSNPTISTVSGASYKDTSIKPQNYWTVGDTISIVNDAKYDDIATVVQIKDGLIQIEWLDGQSPFSTVKLESDLSPEDYSIYCLNRPTQGISDLGKYSFANGTDNEAINIYTEVSGKGNVAKGKFAKVWGKNNVGGYNTTTFGTNNVNLADNSLVNGTNNINEGNNSVIHGNANENYGKRAFVVGNENITYNENEAAFGKYNNSKNDTQFSIGVGTSDTDRKNAYEITQNGKHYIYNIGGYDGTNPDTSSDLATYLPNMVNITYKALSDLKIASKLVPGQQYRITDYITTTIHADIQAVGHQFDLIVTADNESTLNEVARAIQHDGDDYFTDSDLNAWQIWYCLDNDTNRFAWADNSDNGKGVIYRMIDEFGNDCPYDFKNIQFKRWNVTSNDDNLEAALVEGKYLGFKAHSSSYRDLPTQLAIPNDDDFKWCYTFNGTDGTTIFDASLNINGMKCAYNKIAPFKDALGAHLNDVVFNASVNSHNKCINENELAHDCWSMTIGCGEGEVWNNKFGQFSRKNIVGFDNANQNNFGENCNNNCLIEPINGSICASNLFFNGYFQNNVIVGYIQQNKIGYGFKTNTIIGNFMQNNINSNFENNSIVGKFVLNIVEDQFTDNEITGDYKQNFAKGGFMSNIINGACTGNDFGILFQQNTINTRMNYCCFKAAALGNVFNDVINSYFKQAFQNNEITKVVACIFGIGFRHNKFTNSNGVNVGIAGCTFGNYVWYNEFYNVNLTEEGTSKIKNLKVQSYLQGTESAYNLIEVPVDSECEIKVAKNSSGVIKVYNEADLIS